MRKRILPLATWLPGYLATLLTACGPGHYTTYELVAPKTPEGIACANQCLATQSSCITRCQSDASLCRLANTFSSFPVFNRPMFDDHDCDSTMCERRCEQSYRICHTNCGGQVIPHSCVGTNCPTYITR